MDSRLEKLCSVLDSASRGMSDQQLKWHPEGKWCAAETLEHLYLTYTGTIKGLERVLEAGKPLAGRAPMKQRFQALFVLTFSYLPEGRKAPKQTVPRGMPPEKVRSDVARQIAAMDAIITECESRMGPGKLMDHPILGPLTGKQWRQFHLIHGRHHAKQIERLRALVKSVPTIDASKSSGQKMPVS
jgi:hypothetical protein